ncbi:hypothetical protein D3C76_1552180 [compost metagenome]
MTVNGRINGKNPTNGPRKAQKSTNSGKNTIDRVEMTVNGRINGKNLTTGPRKAQKSINSGKNPTKEP